MAENRSGSSEPKKPEPNMISAVLMSGGATRHGMAVAGCGGGAVRAEFMEDFIADSLGRRCPLGLSNDHPCLISHIRLHRSLAKTRRSCLQPAASQGVPAIAAGRCRRSPV